MNPATKVLNEIQDAMRLENRTKKALGPESDEDRVMCDVEQKGDEK